jgi:hypothetical protein
VPFRRLSYLKLMQHTYKGKFVCAGIMSSGGNRHVNSMKEVKIIDGTTVTVKARVVTVKGPRGSLTRDFKHLNVEIYANKNKEGKDVVCVSFFTTFLFCNTVIFTKTNVYCRAQEIKRATEHKSNSMISPR